MSSMPFVGGRILKYAPCGALPSGQVAFDLLGVSRGYSQLPPTIGIVVPFTSPCVRRSRSPFDGAPVFSSAVAFIGGGCGRHSSDLTH